MTAGDRLHIDRTLATLPGFVYGVVMLNYKPGYYGYGPESGRCELFERVTPTGSEWAGSYWLGHLQQPVSPSDTADRHLPPETNWTTKEEAIAWVTQHLLT